jgi:chaperonin GroES
MIKPLNNNVVLKKEKEETEKKTTSGIILSQKKEEHQYAVVVAVGEGKLDSNGKLVKPSVNVGDKVLYKTYSTTSVKLDDCEYLIIPSDDILAIIE